VLIGTNNGSFGASPLEIDANTLTATVTGTGSIDVLDTGGGLTVLQAQAASGLISVKAVAADLTLGDATAGPTVVSTTGAVTLTASGGIISGAPAGTTDVAGASLTASAGNGVGSAGTPLHTAVGTFSANGGNGGGFDVNRGAMTVGGAGGTATGNISLSVPETVPAGAHDQPDAPGGRGGRFDQRGRGAAGRRCADGRGRRVGHGRRDGDTQRRVRRRRERRVGHPARVVGRVGGVHSRRVRGGHIHHQPDLGPGDRADRRAGRGGRVLRDAEYRDDLLGDRRGPRPPRRAPPPPPPPRPPPPATPRGP